jgi:hypothetical protein
MESLLSAGAFRSVGARGTTIWQVARNLEEAAEMKEAGQQGACSRPEKIGSQELFRAPTPEADESPIVQKSANRGSGMVMLLLGAVAVAGVVAITLTQKQYFSTKAATADSDDMGQGVANAAGMRGHLVTRWQQNRVQYMLKMEPLDARDAAGFAAVAANPPKPISINVRLLDAAGFALCGKEIDIHYDPTRNFHANVTLPKKPSDAQVLVAQQQAGLQRLSIEMREKQREAGKDIFQNIQANDGSVEALWSEGELPCSPDQYRKFDYWDITTNFPTRAEQAVLLGHKPLIAGQPQEVAATNESGGPKGRRKPAVKGPVSTFFVEGDDQISMYEPGRGMLTGDSGHSFFIPVKSDQAVAATWAANYSHIHFRCDQHANCALRGGSGEILGRMSD